ncbi:Hypothetical predicted protein [Olea europaea subsp. europaea]|uniref:Uncharacterized protein n=1 Tax=Olea europaea subsp. europaea TaxID=158383 RepID=A0A8S0UMF1_OLEEU|nr:Hypothetical predicted protein [Olea europaea subsp. europaea]
MWTFKKQRPIEFNFHFHFLSDREPSDESVVATRRGRALQATPAKAQVVGPFKFNQTRAVRRGPRGQSSQCQGEAADYRPGGEMLGLAPLGLNSEASARANVTFIRPQAGRRPPSIGNLESEISGST